MRTAVAFALLACAAIGQEKAPLALDAILVKPAELPKGVQLVDGIHCVSPQARTYFETPALKDIMDTLAPELASRLSEQTLAKFPVPTRKECQSFEAAGRPKGSVLAYEYATEEDASAMLVFLASYLWGDHRSEKHPEEIVAQGRFIWVLSFPYPRGDPAAEWYKARLRKKFRVAALRERPGLAALGRELAKAYEAQDAATGLRLLSENAKAAADWSLGQNMLGQFAAMKKDHALAEKAYRKALKLHDTRADPMEPELVWVTLDGLALALHAQGKRPEAVKLLDRAIAAAEELGEGEAKAKGQSLYNRACAYAMMKKYPEALRSLRDALRFDASYAGTARTDADLAEACKQQDFKDLLEDLEQQAKARPQPALTLDAVLVKPEELPANVRAIEGMHTNQPHPQDFYATPTMKGMSEILPPALRGMIPKERMDSFPVPKRKEHQSFHAEGGARGTVFVFEYETDDLGEVTSFLEPILWGRKGPSEEHPEEILAHGRVLWILSFPHGDPACEWYKDRLRRKLRVPALRVRLDLEPLGGELVEFLGKEDADAGLAFLAQNAKAVEQWSFAQFMLGQFGTLKRDPVLAEKGFRNALALHESLADPLRAEFLWGTLDGLGDALGGQGKWPEAARMFERALAAGNELREPWAATRSCYHIACALAAMQQWDQARKALEEVFSVDEEFRKIARTDPALAEARKRKEFQELLR